MLDDDAGRFVEHAYAFDGGVGVRDIVERQLLALEHARRGDAGAAGRELAVERRLLVRVLAVAQVLQFFVNQRQGLRKGILREGFAPEQVRRHHGVVPGGVRECLGGELGARVDAGGAGIGLEVPEDLRVVGRIDDDGHRLVVPGRRTHHCGAADVDVLDGVSVGAVGFRDRCREWIQVNGEQVDARDVVLLHDGIVDAASTEQSAMHARVQRLDAPVHDLGKAGVRRDLDHRNAGVGQRAGGTTGAEDFDFACNQGAREFNDARLVGDRQQGPADRDEHSWKMSGRKAELAQFFAQRPAVDSENGGGAALIARRVIEHGTEQRFFHLAQHQIVQVRRLVAVQVGKVVGQGSLGVVAQRHFERAITPGIFAGPRSFRRHLSRPIACARA